MTIRSLVSALTLCILTLSSVTKAQSPNEGFFFDDPTCSQQLLKNLHESTWSRHEIAALFEEPEPGILEAVCEVAESCVTGIGEVTAGAGISVLSFCVDGIHIFTWWAGTPRADEIFTQP